MSFLIYVNGLGQNYKGEHIYEFIFSDKTEGIWGQDWESKPSNGYPSPPDIEKIKKIRAKQNIEVDSESESEPEDFEKQYMHNKRKNLKTKVNYPVVKEAADKIKGIHTEIEKLSVCVKKLQKIGRAHV